ncbi:hypothetical protein ABK040_012152 [Willaertia magna]
MKNSKLSSTARKVVFGSKNSILSSSIAPKRNFHQNLVIGTTTNVSTTEAIPSACPYHQVQQQTKTSEQPKQPKPFSEIPGPKGLPLIGNLLLLYKNTKTNIGPFFMNLLDTYGQTVKLEILGKKIVLLSNPDDMEKLYKSEEKRTQSESSRFYKIERNIRLAPMEMRFEENWNDIRQIYNIAMKPDFHETVTLPHLSELNSEFIKRLVKYLEPTGEPDKYRLVNAVGAISKYGFDAVMKVFLGVKMTEELTSTFPFAISDFVNQSVISLDIIGKLMTGPPLYKYWKTPLYRQLEDSYDKSFEYARYVMRRFKDNPSDKPRFYEFLMERSKNDPNPDAVVESVMISFLQAGIDITMRMLCISAYRLAHHPEYQEKIYQELLEVFGEPTLEEATSEHGLQVTKEQYKKLKFTKYFLDEVLRVNPFSYVVSAREMTKDLEVGGYILPKDSMVMTVQQHPSLKDEYVPRAKEFLPERWEKGSPLAPTNSYISAPFGIGARKCPGSRIASTEIHFAIINFVRHFKLSHANPQKFPDMSFDQALLYIDLKQHALYFTPRDHLKDYCKSVQKK